MTATGSALRSGSVVSTTDLWKAAALLIILLDHYGHYLAPGEPWWRVLGRSALPIWFFFIGFARTRPVPWTWIAAGVGLTLLDAWFQGGVSGVYLNILINFALIRLALPFIERVIWPSRLLLVAFIVALAAMAPFANGVVEYGTEGWLLALVGLAHRRMLEAPGGDTGEAFWRRVALAVAAGAVFVVVEAVDYAFDVNQTVALVLLVAFVTALLGQFRRADLALALPRWQAAALNACGRHSLWIYAAQIVVFTGLAVLIAR